MLKLIQSNNILVIIIPCKNFPHIIICFLPTTIAETNNMHDVGEVHWLRLDGYIDAPTFTEADADLATEAFWEMVVPMQLIAKVTG